MNRAPDIQALSFDCTAHARPVLEKLLGPPTVVITDGETFNIYYKLTAPVKGEDKEGQRKFKQIGEYAARITNNNVQLNLEFCCTNLDTLLKKYPIPKELRQ
jgi:hypothetical protein